MSRLDVDLRSPYPWFGGKSKVAGLVWSRFGRVANYVEPFFGSGAMLLGRPKQLLGGIETVNDINGWLCNFWRALQADPEGVAKYADWPVSELDLHARGDWLFYRPEATAFVERLRRDPDYYDVKSAGWWVWGQSCWIGDGWGKDGKRGAVRRQKPHLGDGGNGVSRVSLGDGLRQYLRGLSDRMRRVRVCCGDWTRVCVPVVTNRHDRTAVFLDPPYAVEDRYGRVYGNDDSKVLAHAVREWAIQAGREPQMRIALCGYEGEHAMPSDWRCEKWKARGGMNNMSGSQNRLRERIWFSPECLPPQPDLFSTLCYADDSA